MNRKIVKKVFIVICILTLTTKVYTVYADDVDNEEENISNYEDIEDVSTSNVKENLKINSNRYVVFDRNSKRVLYGKNENVKGAMASTTKIMTSIVVIENAKLDDIVTISKKASSVGGSRLKLNAGDKVSVKDLLYGLMLRSGNDAAIALAEHVGGDVNSFIVFMNEKAKKLGLLNTHFVTPHGLDNEEHYTTAVELARITDYALENELFRTIVGTNTTDIHINGQTREIRNTNELLGVLDGVVGVKTGFTNKAGRCLVTETKRKDMDIITVVLGANTKKDRTRDSINLINYIFSKYKMVNIKELIEEEFNRWNNKNLNSVKVIKGKEENTKIDLGKINLSRMAMKENETDSLKCEIKVLQKLDAPIRKEERVGTLIVKIGDKIIDNIEIINSKNIDKKEWLDYFKEMIKSLKIM